jgi:hypothetical protein
MNALKELKAVEIRKVSCDAFAALLTHLREIEEKSLDADWEGESNGGGWVLPLLTGNNDEHGWMVLFPKMLQVGETQALIERMLSLELSDYDVISIWDDR